MFWISREAELYFVLATQDKTPGTVAADVPRANDTNTHEFASYTRQLSSIS
jgi:hypothetical protein